MEQTKKCPYCGEEILAVAKKCKHCGEWLEEKPMVEVKKIACPICGEMIEETATVCPYCNEKVEKAAPAPRNAFKEKVMAEKTVSQNKENADRKKWIYGAVAVAVIAIVCALAFSSKPSSSSNDNSYAADSMVVVEEMPEEVVEEEVIYDYDGYQYRDHSAQGADDYQEDNTIHSLEEY